jgi:hypothetical protein
VKLSMYLNREHVLEQWFMTAKDMYLAMNIFGEKRDYVGHLKSSAHCACVASRMMQSF